MHRQGRWTPWGWITLTLMSTAVHAQEWTRFRGPNGSGVSAATTVPRKWSAEDYNWQCDLPGIGHSSPVLWGKRIFVTSGEEATGKRYVICLDADSGQERWRKVFDAARHRKHKLNSFASTSPVVDADSVYLCWGTPEELAVLALDHQGQLKWRRNLGPFLGGHGFGAT